MGKKQQNDAAGRESLRMLDVHHKFPRGAITSQRRGLRSIEFQLLRPVDGRQCTVGRVPADLAAAIATVALVVEVELDEGAGGVLGTAGDGV